MKRGINNLRAGRLLFYSGGLSLCWHRGRAKIVQNMLTQYLNAPKNHNINNNNDYYQKITSKLLGSDFIVN